MMASRKGQFLLFDALPFLRPLPLDLLRRGHVGMVDAAAWIGARPRGNSTPPKSVLAAAWFPESFSRERQSWPETVGRNTLCRIKVKGVRTTRILWAWGLGKRFWRPSPGLQLRNPEVFASLM
jgi:hypothetical protein